MGSGVELHSLGHSGAVGLQLAYSHTREHEQAQFRSAETNLGQQNCTAGSETQEK